MDEKIKKFKDGIFALNTRRFGKVAELMIKKLYELKDSDNLAYDLKAVNGKKIEVKFSTVLKKCESTIDDSNLIKVVIDSNLENRKLTFEESKKFKFDCNIQQVKGKEFDYLYYGCFFEDIIMVCGISPAEIKNGNISYSDHQHRGNVGEGQFHINNLTIKKHIDKYLICWLTYEDLFEMFEPEKVAN